MTKIIGNKKKKGNVAGRKVMMFNSIEEALDDLKQGKMVIVYDEAAEMEGDFVTLARKTTPETINFMSKYGRGLICMPVSPGIAKKLQLSPMVEEQAKMERYYVTLARKTTPETINFMSKYGRGLICMPVSPGIAKKLQLSPMVEEQAGSSNTAFTVTVDHVSTTTGTSAFDRAKT